MSAADNVLATMSGYHRNRAALMLLDEARAEIGETLKASRTSSRYSFKRLLVASGELDLSRAPVEMEISAELAQKYGREPRMVNGAFVPLGLQRDLNVGTPSAGGSLVAGGEQLAAGVPNASNDILSLCTVDTNVPAGAQQVGRFDTLPTPTVLATETSTISETSPATSRTLLAPSNAGVYVELSRSFAVASEMGAAAAIRLLQNAMRTHAVQQICEGSGASGQVLGLCADTAITNASGTTVTAATLFAAMEPPEKTGGDGKLTWVVSSAAAKLLRARAVISGGGAILADNKIGGYDAVIVGGTASSFAIFGRWQDLIVHQWGVLEISTNPFAQFQAGIIGIRAWLSFNAAPLVNASFSTVTAIT